MNESAIRSALERYPRLIADCDRYKELGWYPSGGEVYKFAVRPSVQAVDRFADHVFGGIGFEPDDYMLGPTAFGIDGYGHRRPELSPEARARHQTIFNNGLVLECRALMNSSPGRIDDWVRLIGDDGRFGGIRLPFSVGAHRGFSTLHALRIARRAITVSELMRARGRSVNTLVEIGGGHGRSLRDLIWMFGVETAFYTDLPLNMLLATRFLGHFFGDRVNLVWSEDDTVVGGGINIVAPWLIDRIAVPVDLLVNFYSFQHMSMEALRYYADRLIKPRAAALYHLNREQRRDTFDVAVPDYPFRDAFTVAAAAEYGVSKDGQNRVLGRIVGELMIRK